MIKILQGNCLDKLKELPDQSVNTCITSPPYWGLRDYGTAEWEGGDENCEHEGIVIGNNRNFVDREGRGSNKKTLSYGNCVKCGAIRKDNQLGLEETPEKFVNNLVEVFREVKRVLRDDGTVWLNLGDSFLNKQLGCIPFKVAIALQQDNWILRQDIIWHKPNPMVESVRDRCTKAHEYIFLLSKSPKYYFDNEAIKEDAKFPDGPNTPKSIKAVDGVYSKNLQKIGANPKRNKRSVWTVTTKPFKGAHFATFPMDLIEPCVLAGCPEGGTVLDPFGGSGTTGIVASNHNRKAVLIELNTEYIEIAKQRIQDQGGLFTDLEIVSGDSKVLNGDSRV